VVPDHLTAVIANCGILSAVIAEAPNRLGIIRHSLKATDIETLPYPGFPTDMQAQFMALLTLSQATV